MEERVRRGEDLGLVDHVDAHRLEDLGLREMPDPALRHHGDRDRVHDLLDFQGVRHPGDAARRADVRGHALEGHHGDRARLLRDQGLVRVRDVHDHPSLLHLREAPLQELRAESQGLQVEVERH